MERVREERAGEIDGEREGGERETKAGQTLGFSYILMII